MMDCAVLFQRQFHKFHRPVELCERSWRAQVKARFLRRFGRTISFREASRRFKARVPTSFCLGGDLHSSLPVFPEASRFSCVKRPSDDVEMILNCS